MKSKIIALKLFGVLCGFVACFLSIRSFCHGYFYCGVFLFSINFISITINLKHAYQLSFLNS